MNREAGAGGAAYDGWHWACISGSSAGALIYEVFAMKKLVLGSALALAAAFLPARTASAGIDSCGNIHVEADAMCEVEVEGGCVAHCEPVTVEAACAGELEVDCRGNCNLEASASCEASCDVSACEARCNVNPGNFECSADCNAQADATCQAECQGMNNHGECVASCKATSSTTAACS